ncbi:M15 family metallopeptidase [Rhizobium bangladeshense]|uniref:M15 family metallopeptidase n=1 Tax=Rhizobium bangladeshense TaxID=1138189 RepID=UPI00287F64E0|nr:M15 family metallopeptidase [Rhizobium bangladeshense]MBX4912785.1 peptidase M15 [Rhizobium bangladeshense]
MRYAGAQNFAHNPVPGYDAAECVLATTVAEALSNVQKDVRALGLTLLVYDCYRPAAAVHAFAEWAKRAKGFDPAHNPRIAPRQLLTDGYIAARSRHSSGGTVDLTLAEIDGTPLEMGTGFDFFDPAAYTVSPKIADRARANRQKLVKLMRSHGFSNYSREWWHFSFDREPFGGKIFNFPITERQ